MTTVMTTVTTTDPTAPQATVRVTPPSLVSRLVGFFSGPVGLALKIGLLAVVNAVAVWALSILAADGKWIAAAVLVAATVAIDVLYLVPRRAIPLKFLVPGTIFLVCFQLLPIAYTVGVAFTNWSTGHNLPKGEAITAIQRNTLAPPPDGAQYTMTPAEDGDGNLVLLLADDATGVAYVGTEEGLTELPAGTATISGGAVTGAEGYTLLQGEELAGLDQQLSGFVVPTGEGDHFIRAEGLSVAIELEPTFRYDPTADTFTNIDTGTVYSDDGKGSYASTAGEEIEPGWRTYVGLDNFRRIVDDPTVRDPFFRVFVWTVAYATLSVLFTFSLGLFLAMVLNLPGLRFQRLQRSLLVVPYAIPAFLMVLVWAGLLNDDFGIVNKVLGTNIPWLFDAEWAKVSALLVNLWLGFPYFFLVCTGALQAIPSELTEAARVDGATARQVFRRITLPLLLVAVAPLLIASFAFNFNNFGAIFLLTGGGPQAEDQSIAGATDILISYTYKLAFAAGKGQDYGLASAVSIIIFFIVGLISAISFSRSKALENLR